MQEGGWIKLHRSILKWEWYDDINTKTVFLHLLLTVNVSDSKWHGVDIPRGSRVSSYAALSAETCLSVKEVRTAINHLERTGEVARCTHSKFTVFSINNYDKFQEWASNGHSEGKETASNGQQYKNIRSKEYKNDEKCSSNTHHTAQQISEIIEKLGYRWPSGELQEFIAYNEARGWKLTPEEAAPKWERQRQRQAQPRRRSKQDKPMTQKEIDEMNAYLALSNRYPKKAD